jgi:hypothetical protein
LLEKGNNLLSVVPVGELSLLQCGIEWKIKEKIEILFLFCTNFLITDINTQEIIERYAEIDI